MPSASAGNKSPPVPPAASKMRGSSDMIGTPYTENAVIARKNRRFYV
jgi:hypothetical protein